MAKKVTATVKLQLPCGAATPSPPVGPSLAPTGINLGEFIKTFNSQTASQAGLIVSAVVTVRGPFVWPGDQVAPGVDSPQEGSGHRERVCGAQP